MNDWYALSDREILSELGQRLRLARLEKSITQQMLADQCGIHRTTIRDLENGKSVQFLSFLQVIRVLELLERLDDFIPGPMQSPVLAQIQQVKKRVRPIR